MKKSEWNEGMNYIDSQIVEEYINQKDRTIHSKTWIRFTAIAACFLLIAGAVCFALIPWINSTPEDNPYIKPYIPNGEAWNPVIDSRVDEIVLDAFEVGELFPEIKDSNGTNQYTKTFVSSPEYLNLSPITNAEYLPIFSPNDSSSSKKQLKDFISEYSDKATSFFNFDTKEYIIREQQNWDSTIIYSAEIEDGRRTIRFTEEENLLYFNYFDLDSRRLKLKGNMISISNSDTDSQIINKLKNTINYVCNTFGKEYSDVKINRIYSSNQLKTIEIYLYSPEETIFPIDFKNHPMTSEYILLTFYTDWGSGTFCHWDGSKDEAFLSNVSLYKTKESWNEYYSVYGKSKTISVKEAEELLNKGYVFCGHSCSLCMEMQPQVDFTNYNYVDIEYVQEYDSKICVPFYAFYKYIGKSADKIGTYAKTYVPAIEIKGCEQYFESQKENHRNNSFNVEVR